MKHGHSVGYSTTRTYNSWAGMIQRCTNPHYYNFSGYGGRGVTVCPQWINSFETFLSDMGECPKGHSIDRIENNGNYEPGNCRWATPKEQANNRRERRDKSQLCGIKFNKLLVLEFVGRRGKDNMWLCECECGNKKAIRESGLRSGTTKSCGCFRSEYRSMMCRLEPPRKSK